MIITTNILAIPFLVAIWTIDAYLFILIAHSVLGRLTSPWANRLALAFGQVTDPIVRLVRAPLERMRGRPVPSWAPACTSIGAGLILRHVFVWLVVSVF